MTRHQSETVITVYDKQCDSQEPHPHAAAPPTKEGNSPSVRQPMEAISLRLGLWLAIYWLKGRVANFVELELILQI